MNATKTRSPWSSLIHVRTRYQRSVHLERDLSQASWLDGYLFTPLVRGTLSRIGAGLEPNGTARAWSITGPYGSGKSAFALFLSSALGLPSDAKREAARRLVRRSDETLEKRLFRDNAVVGGSGGLLPVVATSQRGPVELSLLEALQAAVEQHWARGTKPTIAKDVAAAAEAARQGNPPRTKQIVRLVEDVALKVRESSHPGSGLLILLDEAGKGLEYAAQSGSKSDINLLQELAEAATRSGDSPIVFVVFMHQSFEHYAGRLTASQRNEWAKVQGRFEDVIFQESPDQVLRMIGDAIAHPTPHEGLLQPFRRLAEDLAPLLALPATLSRKELISLLVASAPLHPVTALTLGPLFRSRFSQNERSLFAFLVSTEPCGFRDFLAATEARPGTLYSPDRLYDYLLSTFGDRLFASHGRHWAQVEEALRRLPANATELDARLVKTIGILGAIGDGGGLSTSEAILSLALSDGLTQLGKDVRAALRRLQDASIILHRKFKNSYELWDGSDLDVETLVNQALANLDPAVSVLPRLQRVLEPRPVVARRHLFETGTLRFFGVTYVNESAVDSGFPAISGDFDGQIYLLVPSLGVSRERMIARLAEPMTWLASSADKRPLLVALPRDAEQLRTLALELMALDQVQTSTPELQGDLVARRELDGRISEIECLLRQEIEAVLRAEKPCDWFAREKHHTLNDSKELMRCVSDLCAEAFKKAPVLKNEMLNRRQLSSAAASARRELMQAMLLHGDKASLGIEGCPPELSMYRSLLELHGLHSKKDGVWSFRPPIPRNRGSLAEARSHVLKLLSRAEDERVSLKKIYEDLRRPPYGIKDGPLPVILLALMIELDAELAIYEDGAFTPALSPALLERLLKTPERFELQRVEVAGARHDLFKSLSGILREDTSTDKSSLLVIVKALVRFVRALPEYTRNTCSLSEGALLVRDTILRAKEPGALVFRDLAQACGFKPFSARNAESRAADIRAFVDELQRRLKELGLAYGQLLESVDEELRLALELPTARDVRRRELSARAQRLLPIAGDLQLKGFLMRAGDVALPHSDWLVSLATLLAGKPPEAWFDRDLLQLRSNLNVVSRKFRHLETLTLDQLPADLEEATLLRIAITQPGEAERERVVAVRKSDRRPLETVCTSLRGVLDSGRAELSKENLLAALATVTRDLIAELSHEQPQNARGATAHE